LRCEGKGSSRGGPTGEGKVGGWGVFQVRKGGTKKVKKMWGTVADMDKAGGGKKREKPEVKPQVRGRSSKSRKKRGHTKSKTWMTARVVKGM